jgi:hypothetical protein
MTLAIRNRQPTELEQQYAAMKKQTGDSKKNLDRNNKDNVDASSNMPTDTVTLSGQTEQNPLKLKQSQPLSPVEKQALHIQFSVRA